MKGERFDEKRFGKYRGIIVDNRDPEKRGRVRLSIPSVLSDRESDWALPCLPLGGGTGYGFFAVPEVGARMWVEFEEGDFRRPIWTGTFWHRTSDVPGDASRDEPTTRLIRTPSGHVLQFEDEQGAEQLRIRHPEGAEVLIDTTGSIALTDAGGASMKIDANASQIVIEDSKGNTMTMKTSGTTFEDSNGNKIDMAASGITVSLRRAPSSLSLIDWQSCVPLRA